MNDGIHDLPWSEYLADGRVNISSLLELDKSPQHYRARALGLVGDKDTPAKALGRVLHAAVLEPERFEREVVVWRGKVRRGKEWDAFTVEHRDAIIITPAEHQLCLSLPVAVREHPVAGPLLAEGKAEQTLLWTHEATGIECKSRLDWIAPDAIVDLKTARDCTPHDFQRQSARLHYHTKAAFYQDAHAAVTGQRLPYYLVAVEKEPPFACVVYQVTDDVLRVGRLHYEGLLARLAECREKDEWPGPCGDEVLDLQLPAWALMGDDDMDITLNGELISA